MKYAKEERETQFFHQEGDDYFILETYEKDFINYFIKFPTFVLEKKDTDDKGNITMIRGKLWYNKNICMMKKGFGFPKKKVIQAKLGA